MLEMLRLALPEFVNMTGWDALVVPTDCGEKVKEAGDNDTTGAVATPFPLRETTRLVPFVPFTVRRPARDPDAIGENAMLNPQEVPLAIPGALPGVATTGHVVFCAKSPLI